MGKHYSQLSQEERIEIYHLLECGLSCTRIANAIGRCKSTISREIRRNSKPTKQFPGGYKANRAHMLAMRRRRWDARFKMQRQPALAEHVRQHLAMGWSPQQIAGRLAQTKADMRISHESIYRYIYHRVAAHKDYWYRLLPQRKHRRGRLRRGGIGSVKTIKQRVPVHQRPAIVARRKQPGHWEADLMAFSKYGQYLLVICERTTRAVHIVKLADKTAMHVVRRITRFLKPFPRNMKRTITFDNGTEFAQHFKLKRIGLDTYFCDPHAPWQKGSVENAVGRLRRFLPRKTDLANLTPAGLKKCLARYNNTPRKCLGYQTPAEALASCIRP